jgi:hypothetical protein
MGEVGIYRKTQFLRRPKIALDERMLGGMACHGERSIGAMVTTSK